MNILSWIGWILVALASSVSLAFGVVRASLNSHRTSSAPVSLPLNERSITTDNALVGNQAAHMRGVDMLTFVKRILPEKEKGKPYTQQLHDYARGELNHHTVGLRTAIRLRESGARFAGENELVGEYLRHAHKAVDLYKTTGGDRGGNSKPAPNVDVWFQHRRDALLTGMSGYQQDPSMSRLGLLWAKMTRRLYRGPCQALYQQHQAGLNHAQELLLKAEAYLAEGLNEQALADLRSEGERHLRLSFRPNEKVETF